MVFRTEMSSESIDNQFDSSTDLTSEDRAHEVRSPASVSAKSEPDSNNSVHRESFVNRTLSWHEHVYKKINNRPTPHYIENILGIQRTPADADSEKMPVKISTPSETVPKMTGSVQETNEPLNLSIRNSDVKVRTKTVKGKPFVRLSCCCFSLFGEI